jgi:hypothetical protein
MKLTCALVSVRVCLRQRRHFAAQRCRLLFSVGGGVGVATEIN